MPASGRFIPGRGRYSLRPMSAKSVSPAAFAASFPLRPARVHEVCGPGATAFAAVVAAGGTGSLLWLPAPRGQGALNPLGLAPFFDPARLLVGRARTQPEALGAAEEALRDGVLPLVVIETLEPLSLTAGRRLQLAAGAGGATGLCLIPEREGMGSNAAETRWHAAPLPAGAAADSTPMRWRLIKNKQGTIGAWDVRWDHAARRLDVVSPVGERPGAAGAPD